MDEANETSTRPSVLVVDDDERLRSRLARAFEERGYDVVQAEDHDSALGAVADESTEFAVVDLRMPGKSGLELVRALHQLDAATKIVVLTGYGSIATALDAVRLGATHYLSKPADVDTVIAAFSKGELAPDDPVEATAEETPSLARVEWEHIQRVLSDCNGNISQAAKQLGIHRRSLQRKLAKFPSPR